MVTALFLIGFCQKPGAKRMHAIALEIGAVSLIGLSQASTQWIALIPMIGLGITWSSMVGIPSLMVVSMVPKERTGVYLGILNMMVVVPMLIESVTFGWIFENLLGGKGVNAIMLAGVLFALGAVAMLWVNPPKQADEESALIPLGPRHISVYDHVIVGSDGTPSSLYAVDRAHAVAAEAGSPVLVVSAYSSDSRSAARGRPTSRHEAEAAMKTTVQHLTSDRVRRVHQLITEADPAEALLAAA